MPRAGRLAILVLLAASLSGCMGTSPDGNVSLYITGQGSGDLQEVHVNITEAYVREPGHGEDPGATPGADNPDERGSPDMVTFGEHRDDEESELPRFQEEEGWVEIVHEPLGHDAAFFEDEQVTTFLGERTIDEGSYQQVGFLIDDAYALDTDGQEVDVRITNRAPVAQANLTVEADEETRIVLTVDVDESLSQDEGGEWRLSPTFMNVQVDQVPDGESGSDAHEPGEPAEPQQS